MSPELYLQLPSTHLVHELVGLKDNTKGEAVLWASKQDERVDFNKYISGSVLLNSYSIDNDVDFESPRRVYLAIDLHPGYELWFITERPEDYSLELAHADLLRSVLAPNIKADRSLGYVVEPPKDRGALTLVYKERKLTPGIVLASDIERNASFANTDFYANVEEGIDSLTRFTEAIIRYVQVSSKP